ncbi:MAG: AMIN domain-containing protein [candidate division Zixibacteria bacterium]|nr:AMIN domain-containing protein [candidate division Zixibacteria bacterium]
MKQNKLWFGIIISAIFLLNPFALLWAESNIQNITLQREGDYTKVTILADSPFQFNHFIEEKKEGKPYRIVIDCLNAVNFLPQRSFLQLPSGTITAIRTSQYQTSPAKICRVVLDLKNPAVYKVMDENGKKGVILALSTPQEPVYPLWSAVQEKSVKGGQKTPESIETKPVQSESKSKIVEKPTKTTIASKEKPIEKPKKELTVSTEKEKEIKLSQKTEVTPSEKVKIPDKPVPQVKKEEQKEIPATTEQHKVTESKKIEVAAIDTLKKEPPANIPGKVIEEVPKRKILVYHSGARKDPFSPLTEKKNLALGAIPLPGIEELKLVGILEDHNGFKALLENELGYGYILQPGDKIRNGSVVSIDKERIIFQIQEYGFTKNIALELFTPNQEER